MIPLAKPWAAFQKAPAAPAELIAPSAYHNIPAPIRAALERHGCSLPKNQTSDDEAINVVSGHFAAEKQSDWAALCVIGDRPRVFLLWGGKGRSCSAEIRSGWPLQRKFSEDPADGLFLRKVSPRQILNYRRQFPAGPAPPVTHDGLEVGDEQASLTYYCDAGKWIELRGND